MYLGKLIQESGTIGMGIGITTRIKGVLRQQQGRAIPASRSLNVLKKSEIGPLTEYQRSFLSGRYLLQGGRCFAD
jgi:hypothetical protein